MTVAGELGEVEHVSLVATTTTTPSSVLKAAPGRGRRRERLLGRLREAWTRRDIYMQSDRLPGIVRPRALMSDPLLPVQKPCSDNGPKTGQKEMFKFRPFLPPSSLPRSAQLWSCLVFLNSFSFQPPLSSLCPIVSFQWKDFHIQHKSQRRISW